MYLSEMFEGAPALEVTGLSVDSRSVRPGNIFFAIKGTALDGHKFIGSAVKNGAVAVVHSEPVDVSQYGGGVMPVFFQCDDVKGEQGRLSDLFYGSPSREMTVFGVTGTNGKTTVSSIIEWIYGGYAPCGYMGTNGVRFGDMDVLPSLTTPDVIEVHSDLAEMRKRGAEAVAMEVSSHGLAMRRVEKVDFDCAIFTNMTWDHLDYHKTMENYMQAKSLLFRGIKPSGVAVLNADDAASIDLLKEVCACRYVTYGIDTLADYVARELEYGQRGTSFVLEHGGEHYPVKTNLLAKYNVSNLLSAMAAMHEMGMPLADIIARADSIPQVEGRMEIIDEGQDFMAIVDYAHTPDGYEKIFQFAREIAGKDGHIYAGFGCPGKRDIEKRPVMGEIAGRYCDGIVLTLEDPRDADPAEVARELAVGVERAGCPYQVILDREEAIGALLDMANSGDVVLILGKGDEPYMYMEEGRAPWDGDHIVMRRQLKKRLG